MAGRVRALVAVALLVGAIAGLPAVAPPAASAPRAPQVVTVAVHEMAPFVITRGAVTSGFTVDVLDRVSKHTGWTIDYIEVGNVAEQLRAVADGRADAAAGAVSITAERAEAFDFSQPTLNAGLQIMVPAGLNERSQPGLADFLDLLFSKTMAIWLGVALLLTVIPAHLIWLLERRHAEPMVSRSYFPGIFEAFGWGLGMLAAAPDGSPRHWQTRALAVLWAFVSIIFVAYYTATLTANLTVEKFDAQIGGPSDLFGKKVCTVAKTTSSAYLGDLGVTFDGVGSIEDCYAGLHDRRFEAVVYDAPVLRYYVAQDGAGSADLAGPIFQHEDYGIAFRNGSELRKQLDAALLSMREDGDYALIKRKWFGDPADSGD